MCLLSYIGLTQILEIIIQLLIFSDIKKIIYDKCGGAFIIFLGKFSSRFKHLILQDQSANTEKTNRHADGHIGDLVILVFLLQVVSKHPTKIIPGFGKCNRKGLFFVRE